jgi:hypothetical protein
MECFASLGLREILARTQSMPVVPQHRSAWPSFVVTRFVIERLFAQAALVSVLLFAHAARADAPAPIVRTLQVASACVGACSTPRLVQVDDRRVVAFWRGDDHTLHAQTVDVRAGAALGTPADLGKLLVAGMRENRALQALPLLGGDLVLFGALRDGRITFARGSTDAARRVPSKVILKGSDLAVLSLAAAATPRGFALLVLRGPRIDKGKKREMQVELHRIGPAGESTSAPLSWSAARGSSARLGQCGAQLHAAWLGPEGLTSSTISENGDRSAESVHRYLKQVPYATSPIMCSSGAQAHMLTTWFNRALHLGASNKLSLARLGAAASKPTWKDLELPGKPLAAADSDGQLELSVHNQIVQLMVGGKAGRALIDLDLGSETLGKTAPAPAADTCLTLRSGATTVCAQSENQIDANGCQRSGPVALSVYATTFESPKDRLPDTPYWAKPQIETADAPSAFERSQAREQLHCGEPDWAPLQKALIAFCAEQAERPKAKREQYLSAYCGTEAATLEAQARSCQLPGAGCPGAPKTLPSVEREGYDKGSVGFWQDNCVVWFARENGAWRVTDGECDGD